MNYLNNGTQDAPKLKLFMNMGTLANLPDESSIPKVSGDDLYRLLADTGFQGVQGGDADLATKAGLLIAGSGRVNQVGDIQQITAKAQANGHVGITLHVGWGIEDDAFVDALVQDILESRASAALPCFVETHRATITQDLWRAVMLARRFPTLMFNGDFSHWYTGLEMPYGGVATKLDFAEPVLQRIGFIHARIGNSGSMQVDVGDSLDEAMSRPYVQDFVEMWTRSMTGFLRNAGPGDYLPFAPELLPASNFYARLMPDANHNLVEESDRWQQALLYTELAQHCFEQAKANVA